MRTRFWMVLFAWVLLAIAPIWIATAHAQVTVTNTGPIVGTNQFAPFVPAENALPVTKEEFWKYGLSVITLVLMQLVKKIPKIPNWAIPILAPGVGILLGFGLRYLNQLNLGWVDMASMGALATWIHQAALQTANRQTDVQKD